MPRHFVPKTSGSHRIACVALYRALLSQCSLFQLRADAVGASHSTLQDCVRKQFRSNKHDSSPRLVLAALKLGYSALDLLHSANNGDQAAHSRVFSLLRALQPQSNDGRPVITANAPTLLRKEPFRMPGPYPGAAKMLDVRPRPLDQLKGQRHVPKLVGAQGWPFLRFKKPQSPFLSRVIRDKTKQKQKRVDALNLIDEQVHWAEQEQAWDGMLGLDRDGQSWERDMVRARSYVRSSLRESEEQARSLTARMLEIVDEETRMAKEEQKMRVVCFKNTRGAKCL